MVEAKDNKKFVFSTILNKNLSTALNKKYISAFSQGETVIKD